MQALESLGQLVPPPIPMWVVRATPGGEPRFTPIVWLEAQRSDKEGQLVLRYVLEDDLSDSLFLMTGKLGLHEFHHGAQTPASHIRPKQRYRDTYLSRYSGQFGLLGYAVGTKDGNQWKTYNELWQTEWVNEEERKARQKAKQAERSASASRVSGAH